MGKREVVCLWAMLSLVACNQVQTTERELPAQTVLQVRLSEDIDTAKRKAGDTFTARLEEPISLDGQVVLPKETKITGRITNAQQAQGEGQTALLTLTLDTLHLNGQEYKLQTTNQTFNNPPLKGNPQEIKEAAGAAISKSMTNAVVPKETSFQFVLNSPVRVKS